jgi:hypothetical protein
VDFKNGSKMKCHFLFPPISLWNHPKSQNWLFIQLGTGGLMSWGPFVSTCLHLALPKKTKQNKKLALRTNSYQHVITPTTIRAQLLMALFTTIATLERLLCFFLLVFVISSHFTLDV